MHQTDFNEAVKLVASLEARGWRFGLDRMTELLARLKLHGEPSYLHVAGTNGKGSVTQFLQSILHQEGYRTGGFYSPYVYDTCERVQFGNSCISQPDFVRIVNQVWPVSEELVRSELGGPTEFEFKTAMGVVYWHENNCDFVALEAGLGGRLDATNAIGNVVASIIVSIGLDHCEILGNNLSDIAKEKAGIIRHSRPVIVGDLDPSAFKAIVDVASERGSQVWQLGREFDCKWRSSGLKVYTPGRSYDGLAPGLIGPHQGQNLAIAIAAIEAAGIHVSADAVHKGARSARLPGRMEVVSVGERTFVLDGAHNGAAASCLVQSLIAEGFHRDNCCLVFGMSDGHDEKPVLDVLMPRFSHLIVTRFEARRSKCPSLIAGLVQVGGVHVEQASCVVEAIELAMATTKEVIVVTGSFYLVGEAGVQLKKLFQ